MENDQTPVFNVGEFVSIFNQTLEFAYPSVIIEGEVEAFKVNQGKYVFFNLKDNNASIGCFMMVFSLRTPIEDGMRVVVRARPKLTQWGKFSLTIDAIRPSGEGSIKKSFELLKAKLEKEGLFAADRKRLLPSWPRRVAVVGSVQSAGYSDFMKIANQRMGGVEFIVHHTQVQGADAPAQLEQAVRRVNELDTLPEVLVIIRGGGSADDLSAFNDEMVVRAIAASRVPTLVGVGHEIDVTLSDLAADVRAATPSNAAQLLLPDKQELLVRVARTRGGLVAKMKQVIAEKERVTVSQMDEVAAAIQRQIAVREQSVASINRLLTSYDPAKVLARGYAIVRGSPAIGAHITVETYHEYITAKVTNYEEK